MGMIRMGAGSGTAVVAGAGAGGWVSGHTVQGWHALVRYWWRRAMGIDGTNKKEKKKEFFTIKKCAKKIVLDVKKITFWTRSKFHFELFKL